MSTFKERMKELRNERGFSQRALAKELSVSPGTVASWETGRNQPNYEVLEFLSGFFEVSIDYLLGKADIRTTVEKMLRDSTVKFTNRIPVIGRVAAGRPIPAEEELIGNIVLPDGINADFGLVVVGDSMVPKLNAGDVAFVKKTEMLDNGEIGVVIVNGNESVMKQFYKSRSFIVLKSINEKYDPIVIPAKKWDTECMIVGRIVGKIEKW